MPHTSVIRNDQGHVVGQESFSDELSALLLRDEAGQPIRHQGQYVLRQAPPAPLDGFAVADPNMHTYERYPFAEDAPAERRQECRRRLLCRVEYFRLFHSIGTRQVWCSFPVVTEQSDSVLCEAYYLPTQEPFTPDAKQLAWYEHEHARRAQAAQT